MFFFQVIRGERESREKLVEQFALLAERVISQMDGQDPEDQSLKTSMASSVEQVQDR